MDPAYTNDLRTYKPATRPDENLPVRESCRYAREGRFVLSWFLRQPLLAVLPVLSERGDGVERGW